MRMRPTLASLTAQQPPRAVDHTIPRNTAPEPARRPGPGLSVAPIARYGRFEQ